VVLRVAEGSTHKEEEGMTFIQVMETIISLGYILSHYNQKGIIIKAKIPYKRTKNHSEKFVKLKIF
jgi:hypothetical protein